MAIQTVIDPSNKVPGACIKVSLGVGPRSAGDAPRKVLLYGNKLAAAPHPIDTVVQVLTEEDAVALFGQGSELHLMVVAALTVNRNVDLNCIVVEEGLGPAATEDLIFSGAPAAEPGTVQVWINGAKVTAAIAVGDDSMAVVISMAATINANPDLPATAGAAAGTVAVTANQKGPRGNFIFLRSLKVGAPLVTHSLVSGYLAGGTASDDPQDAIDAAAPVRFHYHVAPYEDAVELAKFRTHVDADAVPEVGQRELFVYGSRDTLALTTTTATTLNAARGQVAWAYNAEHTSGEAAAAMAARRAREESIDPGVNLDEQKLEGLRGPVSLSDIPSTSELVSALNNGITPLVQQSGVQTIVRSITTKSQDGTANPDYGVLDTTKVVVPDFIADTIDAQWGPLFAGTKATEVEDPPPPPGTINPPIVRDFLYQVMKQAEADGLVENVDARADELVVELADVPAGRFNAVVPTDVIEGTHQLSADVRQVG